MIRVAIVDNEINLLNSIKRNLSLDKEIDIVFTAENGKEALDKLEQHLPDILLMDISMPVMNGIEATRKINELYPVVKIMMLTVMDAEDMIFESVMAGAVGYLTKDAPPDKLIQAIKECTEGGAPMSPGIAFKAMQLIKKADKSEKKVLPENNFGLSQREIEILEQIGSGQTYRQISDTLFISPKTVRKHIENIYAKLRVHNKVEAIYLAKKQDLI